MLCTSTSLGFEHYHFSCSNRSFSSSCRRIYSRTTCSSNPTVETYVCSPQKALSRIVSSFTHIFPLFPHNRNHPFAFDIPTTCETEYLGGILTYVHDLAANVPLQFHPLFVRVTHGRFHPTCAAAPQKSAPFSALG